LKEGMGQGWYKSLTVSFMAISNVEESTRMVNML